jgi:tetratricopeptide (TPR) repeat protein
MNRSYIAVITLRVWTIVLTIVLGWQTVGWAGAVEGDRYFQLGVEQFHKEQTESAITAWEKALQEYQTLSDQDAIATTQRNLKAAWLKMADRAYHAKLLGHYAEAKKLNQFALKYFESTPEQLIQSKIAGNLGNVLEALGDYENAVKYHEQSLKLAQAVKNQLAESIATGNLGGVYASMGRYQQAMPLLEKSLELAKSVGNKSAQASALLNLGSAHHSLKQSEPAAKFYQQALQLAEAIPDKLRQSQALGSLGLVAADRQELAKAIQLQKQSLAIAKSIDDPQLQAVALNNLGHTFFSNQDFAAAETTLRQALNLLDGLRPGLTDNYKVSIFDTQLQTYNLLQQVLVAANQPEKALEASEQSRARAFAELLAQRQGQKPDVKPITLSEIRRIAKAQNATLVEYAIVIDDDFKFRGKQRAKEEELVIWVVKPSGEISLRRVPMKGRFGSKGSLNRLVGLARCLSPAPTCPTVAESFELPPTPTTTSSNSAPTYPGLPELYQILIQPIQDLLPKAPASRVVIIPQGGLFLVPFAALPNPQGQYLIEQHTILTAPSIQVLGLTQTQAQRIANRGKGAIVLGNPSPMPDSLAPLPASEKEAKQIAQMLNVPVILGTQATRKTLQPQLSQARIIHLATHGLLAYGQLGQLDIPGAIALSTADQTNGLLTAPEIINFNLNAELVVLSACDTGRGNITGDGVLGLSRAWLGAGASSVVVSLWAVDDLSTAALMVEFYRSLQSGNDRAHALRQAILKTMPQYPSPKDWAAFTLMGQ